MTPEEPIVVQIDGDSDDEFLTIGIKEKVKEYIASNGKELRIPNDIINEAVRWRLERNDCQNRGYVLDGYPKNFGNAENVFVVTPQRPAKKLNEEGEEENPPDEEELAKLLKPKLQTHIYPESVITLHGSDQFLKRRSKELQKAQMKDAMRWHIDKLQKKLKNYNDDNSIELFSKVELINDKLFPTQKFFQQNKTEVFELDANGNQYEMFESMRIYIERFGRPYNYLKSVNYLNEQREQVLIEEEKKAKEGDSKKQEEQNKTLETQKKALEKLAEERLVSVMAHMKELEDCDDLNMRQFLMKYIIPLLTEGMIDVWKVGPLDPVDYLADYIFKKSHGA